MFLLYDLAGVIILIYAGFTGGNLESWITGIASLVLAGIIGYFLLLLMWKGLLVVLLFAGIVIAIWIVTDKLRNRMTVVHKLRRKMKRKRPVVSELGYKIVHLNVQLRTGTITQEQYEQKKKLVEELGELKEQLDSGVITQEEYKQRKKELREKSEQYKQTPLGE